MNAQSKIQILKRLLYAPWRRLGLVFVPRLHQVRKCNGFSTGKFWQRTHSSFLGSEDSKANAGRQRCRVEFGPEPVDSSCGTITHLRCDLPQLQAKLVKNHYFTHVWLFNNSSHIQYILREYYYILGRSQLLRQYKYRYCKDPLLSFQ